MDDQTVDFVIVAPLEEETKAILGKLPNSKRLPPSEDDIRVYYTAPLAVLLPGGERGSYRIIIASPVGMGRLDAATLTVDAINKWKPRYVLVVGIAGGVLDNGVNLGDILVGDQILDYELQKLTASGPEVRPKIHNADQRLLLAAKNLRDNRWHKTKTKRPHAGAPKRHIGPIASGDKILEDSAALAGLCALTPKLLGVEMEAAGVCLAASQTAQAPGVLTIRGVSDPADENRGSPAVSRWRPYAREIAASYAVHFLKSGPIPLAPGPAATPSDRAAPLPKAGQKRFSVALAHLLHDADQQVERMIVEVLRDLEGVQILRLDRTISAEGAVPEEGERAGHEKARSLLEESGAQVLVWGTVLSHDAHTAPRLFWTTASSSMRSRRPYIPENFALPQLFWEDLLHVLRLVALTQSAELFAHRGHYLTERLAPFVDKVRNLMEGGQAIHGWTSAVRTQVMFILALSLETLGEQAKRSDLLAEAIKYYRDVLTEWTRSRIPLNWAVARNNLGVALGVLGTLESSSSFLEEAASIFGDLLEQVVKREAHSDLWATVQNNLGNALLRVGEREAGTRKLHGAIQPYKETQKEWTRERSPLDWAAAESNLALAYKLIGERESPKDYLERSVRSFRSVIEIWTRDTVPMYWAGAQSNLGNALTSLGERETGTERFDEAVQAYRLALSEREFEREPLNWAETQNSLGAVLLAIGNARGDERCIKEAAAALREALTIRTREHQRLAWASTANNLGIALVRLGGYSNDRGHFEEGISLLQGALEEWPRETNQARWSAAQSNLGEAFAGLARAGGSLDNLRRSIDCYQKALEERTRERSALLWAGTNSSLALALHTLGEQEPGTAALYEAVRHFRLALEEQNADRVPLDYARTLFSLGNTLRLFGQREGDGAKCSEALEKHVEACRIALPQNPYWGFRALRAAAEDIAALKDLSDEHYRAAIPKYEWVLPFLAKHERHQITLQAFYRAVVAGTSGTREPDWKSAPRKGDRLKDGAVVWENGGAYSYCVQCKEYLAVSPPS